MSFVTMWRNGSALLIGLSLAIVGVFMALLIRTIVHTLRHVEPVRSTVPPVSAVVWGDRVFVGPGTLGHWLKVRGVGYSVWAGRHPPANHLLQREKARRERPKKK
jgi:hypothetical protein